jgi:hypothetical protein
MSEPIYTAEQAAAVIADLGDEIAAGALLSLVKALKETGMRSGSAFRLASVMLVDQHFGPPALKHLGLAERTRERYYAELRLPALRELSDDLPADFRRLAESWAAEQRRVSTD